MDIAPPLTALGVSADLITDDERRSLDEDGFCFLAGILTDAQCDAIAAAVDAAWEAEHDVKDRVEGVHAGSEVVFNNVDRGAIFDVCYTHPRVLSAIAYVLGGDLKLSSLNARKALPGGGEQGLHPDWLTPREPDEFYVCNSIWMIDAFTASNGATRVVPGSHRARPGDPRRDEVLVTGSRGTVCVFNAHTLHGGTLNTSHGTRRGVHSYFTKRDQPQQLSQRESLAEATVARLTPAQRWILDV